MGLNGLLLLATASLTAAVMQAEDGPVRYRLSPEVNNGVVSTLAVEVKFNADRSGRTVVDLPDTSVGHHDLWRFVSGISAQGAIVQDDGPAKRILISAPGTPITLRYQVGSAYDRDPSGDDGNPYKGPVIRPTWFSSLGEFVFVAPEKRDLAPATFQWGNVPKGWVAVSDLDAGGPLTVSDISNSVVMGGSDVALLQRHLQGGQLRVAIRGVWSFPEEQLVDDIATVVDAQRRFWGKTGGPYFVAAIPLATGAGISVGGTGRFHGFALYGTGNADEPMLRRILAHEHTHNWIPAQQGRTPEGPQEPSVYWYSEGMTDFYTDRTLLRSGVWKTEDFVKHMNEIVREYDVSPVRAAPNSQIVSDFWQGGDIQQLPYQRGYLLAFIWDGKIRAASHGRSSLDQVMFAMKSRYLAAAPAHKPDLIPNFERMSDEVGHIHVATDIDRFAIQGEPISLPESLFGRCATVQTVTIPNFDPGFDLRASAAKGAFAGVDPNGPAYRAGLRDGMRRLQRLGGEPGDSRVEVRYRVLDLVGKEQLISYRPEGKSTISFQQVKRKKGDDSEACAEVMDGQRGPG